MVYIIKKDGTKEEFDAQKIVRAVNKSAQRILYTFSQQEIDFICKFATEHEYSLGKTDIPISDMHNIEEGALEKETPSVAKNYRFLAILLSCMVAGALLGWFKPKWGHNIAFLGTVFINMMFCVVVPMVFCSIAAAIANMKSVKRAGKMMGVTIATFLVTAAIAGVI